MRFANGFAILALISAAPVAMAGGDLPSYAGPSATQSEEPVDSKLTARDVAQGYVTRKEAKRAYGWKG